MDILKQYMTLHMLRRELALAKKRLRTNKTVFLIQIIMVGWCGFFGVIHLRNEDMGFATLQFILLLINVVFGYKNYTELPKLKADILDLEKEVTLLEEDVA